VSHCTVEVLVNIKCANYEGQGHVLRHVFYLLINAFTF